MNAQNQLPLANASLEEIEPNTNNFVYWSNLQTNGGQVNYSIETENLIPGSSRAQKSEIISLGSNGWHVKTHSDYLFQVQSGQQYTVRFWAKVEGDNQATMKVVFQSEVQKEVTRETIKQLMKTGNNLVILLRFQMIQILTD